MANRPHFRLATPQDAFALAELANFAGYGMQLYLWEKLAEAGQSPWDVGRKRAAREHGSFSYRNATVIEHEGQITGCLIGYQIADIPEPIDPKLPPMFRPMQELENLAPGTWHVNILAVLPSLRNKGLGRAAPVRGRNWSKARQARHERHRLRCQRRRTPALRAVRLSRNGQAAHGQGKLDQRWAELGFADKRVLIF